MSIPQTYNDFLRGARFVTFQEANERAKWLMEGIKEHHTKSKGRTDEEIMHQSMRGVICELGIKQALNGQMNDQEFDYRDRSTHGYDLTAYDNAKIEIKLHKDKYFSFYPANIKTMLNNIAENVFDYIVTASFYQDIREGGYVVYPRLLINPKTFRQYATVSNYGRNKPMWYNHHAAAKDGQCIIFNESVINSLQVDWNMI